MIKVNRIKSHKHLLIVTGTYFKYSKMKYQASVFLIYFYEINSKVTDFTINK